MTRGTMPLLPLLLLLCSLPLFGQREIDESGHLFFPPRLSGVLADSDNAGQGEQTLQAVVVEQIALIKSLPILPIVFFDDPGQTELPSRYRLFAGGAEARSEVIDLEAGESAIAVYHNVLNVVGSRMRTYRDHIYLTGCYSADPGESPEVARRRAENVRAYLTDVWRILPKRITMREPRQLGTSTDDEALREEGRAVRIEFENGDLLFPVDYRVLVNRSVSIPLELRLQPNLNSEDVESFKIQTWLDGKLVSSTTLPKPFDSSTYTIRGEWRISPSFTSVLPDDLQVGVELVGRGGRTRTSNSISFGFRSGGVTELHSRHYYLLWDMIPVSAYQVADTALLSADIFNASIRSTSPAALNLRLDVPEWNTVSVPDRPVRYDRSLETFVQGLAIDLPEEIKVHSDGAGGESPDREVVTCGIPYTGSEKEKEKEKAEEKHRREVRDAEHFRILALDATLNHVWFAPREVDSDTIPCMERGEVIIRHVRNYIAELDESAEPEKRGRRSLERTEIHCRGVLPLFAGETPEERCYNRSVQLMFQ